MAIKVNSNNEYIKILFDKCFIDYKGLHCSTIVYSNKEERDKEKSREEEQMIFFMSLDNIIDSDIENFKVLTGVNIDDYSQITEEFLIEKNALTLFFSINNRLSLKYRILEKLRIFSIEDIDKDYLIKLKENTEYAFVESIGFKEEWLTNPIVLKREDMFILDSYKKQDFSIEEFYNILTNNYNTANEETENV